MLVLYKNERYSTFVVRRSAIFSKLTCLETGLWYMALHNFRSVEIVPPFFWLAVPLRTTKVFCRKFQSLMARSMTAAFWLIGDTQKKIVRGEGGGRVKWPNFTFSTYLSRYGELISGHTEKKAEHSLWKSHSLTQSRQRERREGGKEACQKTAQYITRP